MAKSANLGFPRLGIKREWKKACESFWSGKIGHNDLISVADNLTIRHWNLQAAAGIDIIPCNDFAFYDLMLDTAVMLGAIPQRYNADPNSLIYTEIYFSMARGCQDAKTDVTAMEMTKWFDTNYHYIVPEFTCNMQFRLASEHPFNSVERARNAGVKNPRPVLIGPVTFLLLGKAIEDNVSLEKLLERVLTVYEQVLERFYQMNVDWVQIDEPGLVYDLGIKEREYFHHAYQKLSNLTKKPRLMLTTYFGSIEHAIDLVASMGVDGIHLDLVRAPDQLDAALAKIDESQVLSLGVVDGRNVWRTDLDRAFTLLKRAAAKIGKERIIVAPSCSLLHCPIDLNYETELDPELKEWLAFGVQKLKEINILTQALNVEWASRPLSPERPINERIESITTEFEVAREAITRRKTSPRVHDPKVNARVQAISDDLGRRKNPFPQRRAWQQQKLNLPLLPTTTIGSFPQTPEIRKLRSDFRNKGISKAEYEHALEKETIKTISFQERIGLDVLVHGEFERNDMVEYFGEQLEGFAFTQYGWVQSYGSRGVKPPIIYGDIKRTAAMTVRWSKFAQKQTKKPIKGMLTGPVTMLQWSFVRDDQPRSTTCYQLALAIRDEVVDLEKAGINIIQIDEPAIREGLPLKRSEWRTYLDWAIRAFRIASSGVRDDTMIHSHICYSEFNDMIESIAAMDADVLSIEASRSRMDLLDSFHNFIYPNDIGPGIYDVHSPRAPSIEEMVDLIRKALQFVRKEQLWINPDCGLKTRNWNEVEPALANLVAAAKIVRKEVKSPALESGDGAIEEHG